MGLTERSRRAGNAAAAATGALALALFVLTLSPRAVSEEGVRLIAAADALGAADPPGRALFTMLGWVAIRVWPGDPATALALLSALCGAAASLGIARFVHRTNGSRAAAGAAGLVLATSLTFWQKSTAVSAAPLEVFLIVLLLVLARRVGASDASSAERGLAALVAGGVLGLGFVESSATLFVVPAAIALGAAGRDSERPAWKAFLPRVAWPWVAGAGALALAFATIVQSSLWLRGEVQGFRPLVELVREAFERQLASGWSGLADLDSWARVGERLLHEATPAVLPVVLLALTGSSRTGLLGPERRARIVGVLLIACAAVAAARMAPTETPVAFLPGVLGLATLAGVGIGRLLRSPAPSVRSLGLAAAVLVVAIPLAFHVPAPQRDPGGRPIEADAAPPETAARPDP